jgi:hypothetical protein
MIDRLKVDIIGVVAKNRIHSTTYFEKLDPDTVGVLKKSTLI